MSPANVELSVGLPHLAAAIGDALTDVAGNQCAFVLLISHDGVTQYVSNASRSAGIELIESLLARWKEGRADIPAHYNPDLMKD